MQKADVDEELDRLDTHVNEVLERYDDADPSERAAEISASTGVPTPFAGFSSWR